MHFAHKLEDGRRGFGPTFFSGGGVGLNLLRALLKSVINTRVHSEPADNQPVTAAL